MVALALAGAGCGVMTGSYQPPHQSTPESRSAALDLIHRYELSTGLSVAPCLPVMAAVACFSTSASVPAATEMVLANLHRKGLREVNGSYRCSSLGSPDRVTAQGPTVCSFGVSHHGAALSTTVQRRPGRRDETLIVFLA